VGEPAGLPVPRVWRAETHELALAGLGGCTALALMARDAFGPLLAEVTAASAAYGIVMWRCGKTPGLTQLRIRFCASCAFVTWFYFAVGRITPALGSISRDPLLLAWDRSVFGETPAVACQRIATRPLTEVLSLCYLFYLVYLLIVVGHGVLVPDVTCRLSRGLFIGFALGFVGYLLVPALGPARTYPELFAGALAGGPFTRLNAAVVSAGSSGYDTFPSLHVLVTLILLNHDAQHERRRFWLALTPSVGLFFSTIYLRYHYAVDVLAGVLLFLVMRQTVLKAGPENVRLRE
jgi:hypothetical protein